MFQQPRNINYISENLAFSHMSHFVLLMPKRLPMNTSILDGAIGFSSSSASFYP